MVNDQDPDLRKDKTGDALKAQRFQMIKDIAKELEGEVVFPICFDTALRLRKELQNPDLHIERIAKFINVEPLILARLMRMANSVIYNPTGTPVRNSTEAVHRLGLNVVRSTALAIAMNQLMRTKELVHFSGVATSLWEHSIATAAAAQVVSKAKSRLNPESAMLAGLVHDLGAFYTLYRATQYPELRIRPDSIKYLLVEWHESIGETLLNALELPEEIAQAVIDHDRPKALPTMLLSFQDVVFVANLISGACPSWLKIHSAELEPLVKQAREVYSNLLPEIDKNAREMKSVFA